MFCIFASSCAPIKIKDNPWCADAGKFGAECFYIISKKEFSLDKYQWDKLRVGQVCSATKNPGEGYSDFRVALEKLCADTNRCKPEEIEEVKKAEAQMRRVQNKAIKKLYQEVE